MTVTQQRNAIRFGCHLRRARAERDWTAEEVDKACGFHQSTMSWLYEKGYAVPCWAARERISQCIGYDVHRLAMEICGE